MSGLPELSDLVQKVEVEGGCLLADDYCTCCRGSGESVEDNGDVLRCKCVDKEVAREIVKRLTEQLEVEYGE